MTHPLTKKVLLELCTLQEQVIKSFQRDKAQLRNEVIEECDDIVRRYLSAYPPDIFIPPPIGEHGETVDACSASALRAILPNIIRDIDSLKSKE